MVVCTDTETHTRCLESRSFQRLVVLTSLDRSCAAQHDTAQHHVSPLTGALSRFFVLMDGRTTAAVPPLLLLSCVAHREGNADSPAAQALKSQLVSNLGAQNVSLYAVEGLREVTASVMAGIAYVTTHNLAAPMAGSVVVQVGGCCFWAEGGAVLGLTAGLTGQLEKPLWSRALTVIREGGEGAVLAVLGC